MSALRFAPPPAWLTVAVGGAGLVAFAVNVFLADRSLLHAVAVAGLTVLGGAAAWLLLERADVAAITAGILAASGLVHGADRLTILVAPLPLLPLLFRRPWLANAAATAAGAAVGWAVSGSLLGLGGGAAALLVAVARPRAPTQGTLAGVRDVALFLPSVGLAAALALNAVSKRADGDPALDAIGWGVGLAGGFALLACAVLGLLTLLQSTSPRQAGAWAAMAAVTGGVIGSFVPTDATTTMQGLAAGTLATAFLAAIATARLARADAPGRWAWVALPFAAAAAQFGLLR